MSVYIDDMNAAYSRMRMCHMLADTNEELLAMADKIGLDRRWLQKAGTRHEHFDVSKAKKELAVREGAVLIDRLTLGRMLVARRTEVRP